CNHQACRLGAILVRPPTDLTVSVRTHLCLSEIKLAHTDDEVRLRFRTKIRIAEKTFARSKAQSGRWRLLPVANSQNERLWNDPLWRRSGRSKKREVPRVPNF